MLIPFFYRYKRRRAKLRIWKQRLLKQFHHLSSKMPACIQCSLRVSWGPFYGGSVIADRALKKVKIIVQIPYDGFLTLDEQKVMARFRLRHKDLPYFILFHEFAHLLDALPHLQRETIKDYRNDLVTRQQTVQDAADYRKASFEEQADQFAYQCILEYCRKNG